jgi:hypothetical protein
MPFMLQYVKETKMKRWYGVSYGNGNDGVSQSYPSFLVQTDMPWTLARAAMISQWKDKVWASENVDIDGDEDYTIYATIYEGPDGETEFGAAYMIAEIFPVNVTEHNCPQYDNLFTTFDNETVKLVQEGIDQ